MEESSDGSLVIGVGDAKDIEELDKYDCKYELEPYSNFKIELQTC